MSSFTRGGFCQDTSTELVAIAYTDLPWDVAGSCTPCSQWFLFPPWSPGLCCCLSPPKTLRCRGAAETLRFEVELLTAQHIALCGSLSYCFLKLLKTILGFFWSGKFWTSSRKKQTPKNQNKKNTRKSKKNLRSQVRFSFFGEIVENYHGSLLVR